MKKIFNPLAFTLLTILILMLFSSCSKEESEAPSFVSSDQLKADTMTRLKDDDFKVSEFSDFRTNYPSMTSNDLKILEDEFSSSVPAKVIEVIFIATSDSQDIEGKYSFLYAYHNGAWVIVEGKKIDTDNWIITEKK